MISAIALDLGTTSIKAGLLDQYGALSHVFSLSAPQISVASGCYESDALAYAALAEQALTECITPADGCKTLGLCSQRSSFLIWEKTSGQPLTPLISWQDNRGAASCDALRADEKLIRDLTGLPLTPYYFAPKLRAVLQDNLAWRARLERGELLAGTLDTFLIWRWTGGKHFVTDASMAARTLLMDIRRQQWSPQLCGLFGIPPGMLPEIKPSAELSLRLDNGLLLQASVADQSAALFASVGEDRAEALANLGTGCFVVRYLPDDEFVSDGYLHTLVYRDIAQQAHFAIEGTLNSVAAALAPYPVDECRIGDAVTGDIFCVAEPSGLGAPYFRSDIGIRFSRPVEHLAQRQIASLLLEAVVFRVARILEDFHRLSPLECVYLSGGLSELPCLYRGIAQCVPFAVYRLGQAESSLRGAALLAAGLAPAFNRESHKVEIDGNEELLPEKYRLWKRWLDDLLASR
ncbi:MAG: FGGY family carbohydrate kinase [Gallionella sp.]|nr:FGGY family carbohydrate kinase [Gallionella sp.]